MTIVDLREKQTMPHIALPGNTKKTDFNNNYPVDITLTLWEQNCG